MSQKQNRAPTYLAVAINRFRLPNSRDLRVPLEPANFGIQLARLEGSWPRGKTIPVNPPEPITELRFNYYHNGDLLSDHLGELSSFNGKKWGGTFGFQRRCDLTAIWAMATIHHQIGKMAFIQCLGMKASLGQFFPQEIELAEPWGMTPIWSLPGDIFGGLSLIIPKIRKDDDFPRDESLAEAHYALLAIMEDLYNGAAIKQLGKPDRDTGEATKRIMSAPKIFHR